MLIRNAFCVGSHATGKTTLARMISKYYGVPLITETARMVTSALEVSIDHMRSDLNLVDRCQREIFKRQVDEERRHTTVFVSDRAFDNVAYAAEHASLGVTSELAGSSEMREQVERMRSGVVFLVRPHPLVGLSGDGVREQYDWDGMVRIDGMVKLLLELHAIPYVPISTPSIKERWLIVRAVLDACGAPRR